METKSIKELFDKYILIWIWSIFVSINTALSYNIFNLYNVAKWERLNLFLIPLYILAVIMALTSWYSLFNFFKIKIISLLTSFERRRKLEKFDFEDEMIDFKTEDKEIEDNIEKKQLAFKLAYQEREDRIAYKQLKNSFNFIILAILFRFLIPIVEMIIGLYYNL